MHAMAWRRGLGTARQCVSSCGLYHVVRAGRDKHEMKCFNNISRQWKRCHKTEQGSLPGRLLVALSVARLQRGKSLRNTERRQEGPQLSPESCTEGCELSKNMH